MNVITPTHTHTHVKMKKALRETQTLCTVCSKVEPTIPPPAADPFLRARDGQNLNQLEMVTTFICKPRLVRIDAGSFKLSW